MQISVQLFGLSLSEYLPLAQRAEAAGLEAVWLADHVVVPLNYSSAYPYSPDGQPGYDAGTPLADVVTMLAFLAARTERIRLGSGVLVLPLRNPFHVASSWATLHTISNGRAVLGLAVGWMREEFDVVGAPFNDRGSRTDEMVEVLRRLWTGQPTEYHGQHYDFPPVQLASAPQTPVPLVFGGHSEPALRRAARSGDGWFGPYVNLAETARLTARVDELRAETGRAGLPFEHHVRLYGELSGHNLERYGAAGYEHVVVSPSRALRPGARLEDRLAAVDAVASLL